MAEYLIGIDGGGSKTDFVLCDKQLNEKARRFAGRSNPNDIGIDAVAELIKENVLALLSENVRESPLRFGPEGFLPLKCHIFLILLL